MSDKFKTLFSSFTDEWRTPTKLYERLDEEFGFNFDPCPVDSPFNGLKIVWKERNFVNPPFSEWQQWVRKGFEESEKGKLCVFLIASRTDTKAFHEVILPHAKEIRFIKGRLKFSNSGNSAPFPSMIVVFDGRSK